MATASLRLLTDHDREEVLALCDRDPVTNVFVSSRIRAVGMEPARLGGQVWGYSEGGQLTSVCYSGANLVPVAADSAAIAAYRRAGPGCRAGGAPRSWARPPP